MKKTLSILFIMISILFATLSLVRSEEMGTDFILAINYENEIYFKECKVQTKRCSLIDERGLPPHKIENFIINNGQNLGGQVATILKGLLNKDTHSQIALYVYGTQRPYGKVKSQIAAGGILATILMGITSSIYYGTINPLTLIKNFFSGYEMQMPLIFMLLGESLISGITGYFVGSYLYNQNSYGVHDVNLFIDALKYTLEHDMAE